MRSLLYSGDLLAVDLGTFAVKLLHVKAKVRSLTVLGSARREVWKALSEAKTDEEKQGVYTAAVKEMLAETALKTRNASIALSGNAVIMRFLPLPAGFTLDREEPLPEEARALLPFEESDADVSALILDGPAPARTPRAELMLVAAQRKTVQAGMDVVRKAGLRPAIIVNDVLALAGAYEFFQGKKIDETIVLVNAGASTTSLCVVEDGVPRAARVINIAGNAFTRAIRREFSVDFEEAERLKIEHGIAPAQGKPAAEEEVASRVARALMPSVKDLAGEIRRTIDVLAARRPPDYRGVSKVVLAGGAAQLKGLSESLGSELGAQVEIFRPMVNIAGKDGVLGIAALWGDLAVACGLGLSNTLLRRALRGRINLVPKRARRSAIIRDISPGFWKLIAGPVLVVAALSLYAVWAVKLSRKEAAAEQTLEAAKKKEAALARKFTKKRAAAAKPPPSSPYAYLARLKVSGVLGDGRGSMVILDGGNVSYTARAGKLFNADDEEIRGVTSEIRDNSLALTAGGKRYSIDIPR